eukprot:54206-Heterocapsa_arctica.AAC.1
MRLGSGRVLKSIRLLVNLFAETWGGKTAPGVPFADMNSLVPSALEVDPARIAIPEKAGQVRPEDILKGKRREIFCRLDELEIPHSGQCPEPNPCYMVAPKHEKEARDMLLSHGMALLIKEDDVARRLDGLLLLGGMFCVAHKELSDRLIFDRRPQNAGEA